MKVFMILILLLLSVSCTNGNNSTPKSSDAISSGQEMVMYKNPNCRCCTKWAEHMRENGFLIVEKPIDNLSEKKTPWVFLRIKEVVIRPSWEATFLKDMFLRQVLKNS
jgi:hypothetical protein